MDNNVYYMSDYIDSSNEVESTVELFKSSDDVNKSTVQIHADKDVAFADIAMTMSNDDGESITVMLSAIKLLEMVQTMVSHYANTGKGSK